jgi:hypothetical protein
MHQIAFGGGLRLKKHCHFEGPLDGVNLQFLAYLKWLELAVAMALKQRGLEPALST